MYPGLPSRLEKEMKQLYFSRVLHGDPERLSVRLPFHFSKLSQDRLKTDRYSHRLIYRNSRSESKILLDESTWFTWEGEFSFPPSSESFLDH